MPILRSLLPAQERLATPLGSTSPTLFETVVWVLYMYVPQELVSESDVQWDQRFFVLIQED